MMEKSSVPYKNLSKTNFIVQSLLSTCCFCIPLRVGCFILGYLNLVVSLFRTLILLTITAYVGVKSHGFDHVEEEPSSDNLFPHLPNAKINERSYLQSLQWFMLILLTADLIWLAVNIACLVGLHKKRPGPIRTYIGFAIFRLILTFAGFFYQLRRTSKFEDTHYLIQCIEISLAAYFIFVYYMYTLKLEKQMAEENLPSFIRDVSIDHSKPEKHYLVM